MKASDMTLRSLVRRHPVVVAVAAAAAQFLLTILILKAGMAWLPPDHFGQVKLAAFASTVLWPLLLVFALGLTRDAGLWPPSARATPLFWISLLAGLVFLVAGVQVPPGRSPLGELAMQVVNAFGEELLFRGVIFALLLGLPRWQGIVLSGLLFGSMHLIHGVMDGDWAHAALWAAGSSAAGMMFAAVRYATGSLWLVVILHMFINLCMIFSNIELTLGEAVLKSVERGVNLFELLIAATVALGSARWILPSSDDSGRSAT
jgi:membrane protease YdiL (CAAX protease family)